MNNSLISFFLKIIKFLKKFKLIIKKYKKPIKNSLIDEIKNNKLAIKGLILKPFFFKYTICSL